MYWADNSCKLEGAPRPLKTGERHCPYCEGYGYRPRRKDEPSGPKAIWCDYCVGSGLSKKTK